MLVLAASACAAPVSGPESRAAGDRHANVSISHLPTTLWTVTEGVPADAVSNPPDGNAQTQNLTWLLHLVITSKESVPLAIDRVDLEFTHRGQPL